MRSNIKLFTIFFLIFNSTQAQNNTDLILYGNNDSTGKYAKINGAKIYYEEYGKGEPLLLIHGCGGSIKSMSKQINFFKSKFRVIVADSRGHGKSELKTDSLTYNQITKDWEDFIEYLELDSINIIGWSDGGIIAIKMGINNKIKIKKIVAMGANLRPDTTAVNKKPIEKVRKLRIRAKEKIAKNDTSNNWSLSLQLFNLLLDQPNINKTELKKISASVLIMVGDRDIIKNEHAVEIFNNIPQSQLCIMPGINHGAPWNNSIIFNEIANKFLQESFSYD